MPPRQPFEYMRRIAERNCHGGFLGEAMVTKGTCPCLHMCVCRRRNRLRHKGVCTGDNNDYDGKYGFSMMELWAITGALEDSGGEK